MIIQNFFAGYTVICYCVGFDVLTAVLTESSVFWDRTQCSLLKANRRFGGSCRLHLQG
jgi:hypothetical protein